MLTIGVQINAFCVKNNPKEKFANSNIVRANMKSNIYIIFYFAFESHKRYEYKQRYIKTIENNDITLNLSLKT